jgi:pyridoxal 5'-phosphate synthase pdxT subunit
MSNIGVLAVQGAFERHAEVLRALGHAVTLVRDAREFAGLQGLVLPGGESTVQLQLIERLSLEAPLRALIERGAPVLATCAGLILLARGVEAPSQASFAVLDVDVRRNAWGRQLDSFEACSDDSSRELIFIRAPRICRVGPGVEVLATYRGEPVLVRQRHVTAATFHPELAGRSQLHREVFGAVAAFPDTAEWVGSTVDRMPSSHSDENASAWQR